MLKTFLRPYLLQFPEFWLWSPEILSADLCAVWTNPAPRGIPVICMRNCVPTRFLWSESCNPLVYFWFVSAVRFLLYLKERPIWKHLSSCIWSPSFLIVCDIMKRAPVQFLIEQCSDSWVKIVIDVRKVEKQLFLRLFLPLLYNFSMRAVQRRWIMDFSDPSKNSARVVKLPLTTLPSLGRSVCFTVALSALHSH